MEAILATDAISGELPGEPNAGISLVPGSG
jgi:hypothetical protein